MSRAAIKVENLSKAYHIGLKVDRADTLVSALHGLVRAPVKNFRRLARMNTFKHCGEAEDIYWALKDVSFEVAEGEVVGIIGRNGAGKSTLLKILSRITEPTSGRAVIHGRVSSLLEVGTGFHPELTGRENVYMNGTILGMTRREIDGKFDEIVDFSGVEKFLDTPIKHYSSGMKVRLAFAVAAHLEPEILIIDEVLAVGDTEFQKKCLGKMQDVARGGRTVLFVSHNMMAVQNLCTRGIYLLSGRVRAFGECGEIVELYTAECEGHLQTIWKWNGQADDAAIRILSFGVDCCGTQPELKLLVSIDVQSTQRHEPAFAAIDFFDHSGSWIMQAIPTLERFAAHSESPQRYQFEVELPPLIPGEYRVGVWFGSTFTRTIKELKEAVAFTVDESPTPGRTVPHSTAKGHVVPVSRLVDNEQTVYSRQLTSSIVPSLSESHTTGSRR